MTMKRQFLFLLLILGLAAPAFAGKIYGSITEGGKPVAQGVKVEVTCGSNNYNAQTDSYGAFNLFAMDKGKCMLKVLYQGQTPSIEINSTFCGVVPNRTCKARNACEVELANRQNCFSPGFS